MLRLSWAAPADLQVIGGSAWRWPPPSRAAWTRRAAPKHGRAAKAHTGPQARHRDHNTKAAELNRFS